MRKGAVSKATFLVPIQVDPDGDEFHAWSPALKGLHTCGGTQEEALQNAIHAAEAYLRTLIETGRPIPIGIMETQAPKPPGTVRRPSEWQQATISVAL